MPFIKKQTSKGLILSRSNASGKKRLLIVSPRKYGDAPLMGYAEALLNRVLDHTDETIGAWEEVIVVAADGKVSEQVKRHDADHVMLVGRGLAPLLIKPSGLKVTDAGQMMGLLVNYSGRRWISTPSFGVYGIGQEASWTNASLMGHLYRHLELLRVGHVGGVDTSPVKHRTIKGPEDWREFTKVLEAGKHVAIDTETRNLERIRNTVLTIQFCTDGQWGWVLPLGHNENPLEPKVVKKAQSYLQEYFHDAKECTHVYHTAQFDLHQLTTCLKLEWYNHKVYDITAGNFNLDENTMFRDKALGVSGYSLERMSREYGLHFYEDSPIAKSDRGRIYALPLATVAKYGAIDVVSPWRIRNMQLNLAAWRDKKHAHAPYKNFEKCITDVIGRQLTQFVAMERNGLLVDRAYLVAAQGIQSPFAKETSAIVVKLKAFKEVQKANKLVLTSKGVGQNTLFGASGWYFDFGKPAHKQTLFFDVMKLKPLATRADGGGKLDKAFQAAYKENPVVKEYVNLEEMKKLQSTFIVGFYKILVSHPDNKDGRIRTVFKWRVVITGRSSSTEPNLQNIPTRSARAKGVKRQFIATRGRLFVKRDFSAHEIRGWGLVSGDEALASVFWKGMITRLKFEALREIEKDEVAAWDLKLNLADVHIQNYAMLYSVKPETVDKPKRDSVKKTIFGAVYGKGIPSIANDIGKSEEEAEEVYDLIFKKKFPSGGKYLERTKARGRRTMRAVSPIGRVRHLYGHLHLERRIHAAMDRRGPNSIIQGFGSDIGFVGGYFARMLVYKWFTKRGVDLGYYQCNTVHDSNESECTIVNIPIVEYLQHHAYTTLCHRWLRDTYGITQSVGFEMDSEVGACMASLKKANHYTKLVAGIKSGIEWGNENLHWELDPDPIMKIVEHNAKIVHSFRRKEIRLQLDNENKTNFDMLITRANCLDIGLKFKMPSETASRKKDRISIDELEDA